MTMKNPVYIVKESGERELWDSRKLARSLRAARANEELVAEIVSHIEKDIGDGIRTRDIYAHAFALLKRYAKPVAAEYSLRLAMMQFGPSGFPFERFVAEILRAKGYRTKVGTTVPGACVSHEVDVIAENDDERILVEAKFHNSTAIKSDVKVALYVHARFQDIKKRLEQHEQGERFTHSWLITNTSFTTQAIEYGNCVGMALTGWNYPSGRTLQDLVQETGMHPITCLTSLSTAHKNALLDSGVVLCRDVITDTTHLSRIGLNKARIESVQREATGLCPVSVIK